LTAHNANIATGWSGSAGDMSWEFGEFALGLAVSPADPDRLALTDLGFVHVSADGGRRPLPDERPRRDLAAHQSRCRSSVTHSRVPSTRGTRAVLRQGCTRRRRRPRRPQHSSPHGIPPLACRGWSSSTSGSWTRAAVSYQTASDAALAGSVGAFCLSEALAHVPSRSVCAR
jgi:hypothetical protein